MFIAYAVLLPIGIFIAAHMKVALSAHGMWFQVCVLHCHGMCGMCGMVYDAITSVLYTTVHCIKI